MHYLTVVGSRETPMLYLKTLRRLTEQAVRDLGVQVRSGGADGADTAAELGVRDCISLRGQLSETETSYGALLRKHLRVYLPYNGFNRHQAHGLSPYVDAKALPAWEEAKAIALSIHPNPRALLNAKNNFSLLAHTRNVFQVLGDDLHSPSQLLLCYGTADKQGDVIGGTRTAWMLAKSHGIPTYNLAIHTPDLAFRHLCQLIPPSPQRLKAMGDTYP